MTDVRIEEAARPAWLTVERAAYIAVGLLAAALRLAALGLRPLTDGEAAQALAAFRFVQGSIDTAPAGTVPALFSSNVVAFTLFGASDVVARWLPAVAGIVLVLLPYWLRRRLGRGGALAAALFLAISPTAVYFSRAVDGAIVVAACALAAVTGLLHYVDTRRPAGLYVAAAALGLGLCAGLGIVTVVLILTVYGLWLWASARWLGGSGGWTEVADAWHSLRSEPGLLARLGITLAAAFGLVATALVLHPAGIGLAADLLGAWMRDWGAETNGQAALYPVLLLVLYETLTTVLGVGEALRWGVSRRRDEPGLSHTGLLAFWAAAGGLLLLIAGHRPPGNLLLVVAPLALLAGQGVERGWRWIGRRVSWADVGLVAAVALGIAFFMYLQLAAYSLATAGMTVAIAGSELPISTGHLLLGLLAVVLLAALGIASVYWRGPALAAAGGWLLLAVLLVAFSFKTMWAASVTRPADPRTLLSLRPTLPEVRLLVNDLEALSETRTSDAHRVPVVLENRTGAAMAWYLRDFQQLTVVDSLAAQTAPAGMQAAVTLAAEDLPIGETFRGEEFPLHSSWQPYGLSLQYWVRWLLFGDTPLPVVDEQVVLWTTASR